jgi:hypothetical protein
LVRCCCPLPPLHNTFFSPPPENLEGRIILPGYCCDFNSCCKEPGARRRI